MILYSKNYFVLLLLCISATYQAATIKPQDVHQPVSEGRTFENKQSTPKRYVAPRYYRLLQDAETSPSTSIQGDDFALHSRSRVYPRKLHKRVGEKRPGEDDTVDEDPVRKKKLTEAKRLQTAFEDAVFNGGLVTALDAHIREGRTDFLVLEASIY
ncbi:hypothetical protein H072_634 [Dactylellina haptotyla CBS 200.50]|uniref:Uncharacterized protein n=1 Tax=Dactylellina haptotyla (strain CBS 200.50) TaxID=1284197 RepID=S8ARE0_DACHA|nr:hypothetical protein H072_634 [Dactylellina haptotyla CBS 200.50]